jgi:hypothetical protein
VNSSAAITVNAMPVQARSDGRGPDLVVVRAAFIEISLLDGMTVGAVWCGRPQVVVKTTSTQ